MVVSDDENSESVSILNRHDEESDGTRVVDDWLDEVEDAREAAADFRAEYGDLDGVESVGARVAEDDDADVPERVISVLATLECDTRELPDEYRGFRVVIDRGSIADG